MNVFIAVWHREKFESFKHKTNLTTRKRYYIYISETELTIVYTSDWGTNTEQKY